MDIYRVLLCLGLCTGALAALACDDIDTSACRLLAASRPDFCSDITLATSACARFCKLCPLECYHCNDTVRDPNDCNMTMLCADGEVCMIKHLHAYADSHDEYHLTCERKEMCDGVGLKLPFIGKRDIHPRDVSVHCCAEDLCNNPGLAPTNQACNKDVVFMVDQSAQVTFDEFRSLLSFLFHLVQGMNISSTESLVGLYTYDVSVHQAFALDTYSTMSNVLQALTHDIHPSHSGLTQLFRADTNDAVTFLLQHALTPSGGDRVAFADAVVIIADTSTAHALNSQLKQQLGQRSKDVIVVSVGPDTGNSGADNAATDSGHVVHASSYDMLKTDKSIATKLLSLITKC